MHMQGLKARVKNSVGPLMDNDHSPVPTKRWEICWMHFLHLYLLTRSLTVDRLVLVLAHPGNPGQSPQGCKTGVRVCVCVDTRH